MSKSLNNRSGTIGDSVNGTLTLSSVNGNSSTTLQDDGNLIIRPSTSTASVAMGYLAGYTPGSSIPSNQICLNAQGSSLYSSQTGACFIAPVRNDQTTTSVLAYNTSTKEVSEKTSQGMTVQVFTSSDTWTRPSGCLSVKVTVVGGGGAGGGADGAVANADAGGGGGAGGKAIGWLDVSSISSSTITVGAGGTGSSDADGGNGGNSSWADGTNTLTGNGGSGGAKGNTSNGAFFTASGGAGGTASGGDINISGEAGHGSFQAGITIADANESAWVVCITGKGGSTNYGHGGISQLKGSTVASAGNGTAGTGYGSGGSGSFSTQTGGTASTGGAGTAGIIIVEEHYY